MKKVLESESFKIFYDEKDEQLAKKSEGQLVENPDQSVCFIMEGLATYLSGQNYNPNVRADYDCQTMCNYQTFFELEDPYSVAQVYVRRMLEKLSSEEVIEYSENLEKLWNDWAKIF